MQCCNNVEKFSLQVLVPSNKNSDQWTPVATYGKDGRTYIYGSDSKVFRLKFINRTARKVLAVFSIDGLSTVDGKAFESKSFPPGYVVDAYGSVTVKGWSMSNEESAQFIFKDKTDSYAALTGEAGSSDSAANCGVIGCLVYSEAPKKDAWKEEVARLQKAVDVLQKQEEAAIKKLWRHPWAPDWVWTGYPVYPDYHSTITCSCSTNIPNATQSEQSAVTINYAHFGAQEPAAEKTDVPGFTLGTGFGDTQKDATSTVTFERDCLVESFLIYYTSKEQLTKAGIDVDRHSTKSQVAGLPQAFGGFCVPPKSR